MWLISMEMYAAHKQTGARLIRAVPLIHCQHSDRRLFLVHFTKQMYLIKRDTPELRKTDRHKQRTGKVGFLQRMGFGPVVKECRCGCEMPSHTA